MPGAGLDFLFETPMTNSDFDLELRDSLIIEGYEKAGGAPCSAERPAHARVAMTHFDDGLRKTECLGKRGGARTIDIGTQCSAPFGSARFGWRG